MEEKRKRLMFELADIEVESILSVSHKDRLHIVVYGIPGMNVMSNEELIDYAKSEYINKYFGKDRDNSLVDVVAELEAELAIEDMLTT